MNDWVSGKRRRKIRKKKPTGETPNYSQAKAILNQGNSDERRNLALHENIEPEILYYLANDKDPWVRREIADNDGTPLQADLILAKDEDEEVRTELAHKLGRLLPDISASQQDQLSKMALDILDLLAQDQVAEVRSIVADEIKHASNLPENVIKRLAMDAESTVSTKILEYSPLLSDNDLLEIVALGIESEALERIDAIAKREKLAENVVDAIVECGGGAVIPTLLKNKSAKISDATIDFIAIEAEQREEWHPPLVNRGNIPTRTIKRIANFVSAALFECLIENNDVTEADIEDMRMEVRKRIDFNELLESESDTDKAKAMALTESLYHRGNLSEDVLSAAIDISDQHFVQCALSLMSGLSPGVVTKILSSGSGKAVVSLCWKAKLSMRTAAKLQHKIAKIRPNSIIRARSRSQYPLTNDDMEWQIEFYDQ